MSILSTLRSYFPGARRDAGPSAWQLDRAAAYQAAANTAINAAFELAQPREDLWQLADFKDADASLKSSIRKKMRSRARYEANNNAIVARVVDAWVTDVVGEDGPTLQVSTGVKSADRKIEDDWRRDWEDNNWSAELTTAVRADAIDGEGLGLLSLSYSGVNCVAIEVDRLASPYWSDEILSNYVDGVHLDPLTRRPRAYDILRVHPGSEALDMLAMLNEFDTLPAAMIQHVFDRRRPEQHRGFPRMAPSLPVAGLARKFAEARTHTEQLHAAFSFIMKTTMPIPADNAEEAARIRDGWFRTVSLPNRVGAGMMLPNGVDITQLEPRGGAESVEKMNEVVAGYVGGCFTMPLSRALGRSATAGGYAGVRSDMEPYHARIVSERSKMWTPNWMNPLFAAWWLVYRSQNPDFQGLRPKKTWKYPGKQLVVDPSREEEANLKKLKMGKTTREDLLEGIDIDEFDERAAKQFNMTKEEYRDCIARATFGSAPDRAPKVDTPPPPKSGEAATKTDSAASEIAVPAR